jgi:Tfp pilus assembly protein PilN
MKPIHIDFAPRSIARTVYVTPLVTWIVIFAAVACWLGVTVKAVHLIKQKETLAAMLSEVSKRVQAQLDERAAKKQAANSFTIPERQAVAVNNAIAQLNLPWRDLFDALESATPATIALLAIEPDAKKRVLKGIAEAKSGEEMVAYIEQVKKQPFFVGVLLTKHEINEQDPNKPIRFQFEAQWVEAMP